MACLATLETLAVLGGHHALPQDVEVGLVRGQTQHDQVRIRTVDAVARVGIEAWLGALRPNEVQNFVLAFTWHESVRKHHTHTFP